MKLIIEGKHRCVSISKKEPFWESWKTVLIGINLNKHISADNNTLCKLCTRKYTGCSFSFKSLSIGDNTKVCIGWKYPEMIM